MGRRAFVKDRILEAAFDLFAKEGYEAVSTRDIATAAQVGSASMYRHFPSKEALGHELYARAMKPFAEGIEQIAEDEPSPQLALAAIMTLLYEAYDTRPRALALLIFPPHEFTPEALDRSNPASIRNHIGRLLKLDEDPLAICWGAMLGPLHDRYLHRRAGKMGPQAPAHIALIAPLLTGGSSC